MRHVWAPIAPETGDEPCETWKWCIRCGALKLGNVIFEYGPHQGTTLISAAGMKRTKEAKVCRESDVMPKDVEEFCMTAPAGAAQRIGACVEDLKDNAAQALSERDFKVVPLKEDISYLHDMAGWSWDDIREELGMKKEKA